MTYCLLDASALVLFYQQANARLEQIFRHKAENKAFIYLPQFCVPEVFNTFARLRFREKRIDEQQYTEYRDIFSQHISNRKILYCYDLHRYHNLNAHEIFEIEHTVPYNGTKAMSTFDILIIAMDMELMKVHPPKQVVIVTGDKRIAMICRSSDRFPQPIVVTDRRVSIKSAGKR